MTKPFLGDRRASFEELFFAKQDAKVIAALRQAHERKAAIEGLARASNIEDPELLERLVDLGIDARSWTALSLVPLVEVAWADGTIDEKERTAILAAAGEHGLHRTSPGYVLLETFLHDRPDAALFASWGGAMTEFASQLTPTDAQAYDMMGQRMAKDGYVRANG